MRKSFDHQSSLLSAWRWTALGEELNVVQKPYLQADRTLVRTFRDSWKQRGFKINVGISWQSAAKVRGPLKSVSPHLLKALVSNENVTFHCLQYDCDQQEINNLSREFGRRIEIDADTDLRNDIDRLAAQIRALNLVISIDNSTVHIAGAVGTPCWVMLPVSSDWRWGTSSETTLYSGMRLYRQKSSGKWSDVLTKVVLDFGHWVDTIEHNSKMWN
jgi:ADP-heptose:LPS heptosyltransferase